MLQHLLSLPWFSEVSLYDLQYTKCSTLYQVFNAGIFFEKAFSRYVSKCTLRLLGQKSSTQRVPEKTVSNTINQMPKNPRHVSDANEFSH